MTDTGTASPEPTELDQTRQRELQILSEDAVLRGHPHGDEQCKNCLYYLDVDASISYCWHPKLRVLAGQDWWCQWWEEIPAEALARPLSRFRRILLPPLAPPVLPRENAELR